jgi:hypothetical protein
MNRRTSFVLTISAIILCGFPGILSSLGGIFITGFGLLADRAQLKLDTNLDQTSVILTGIGGFCLGIILVIIPILIWSQTKRQNPN